MDISFDRTECVAIQHFAGSGRDAPSGDVDYGLCGVVERVENCEQGLHGFREARELHRDLGKQSKSAFGTDEQAGQVVARRIEGGTSDSNQLSGRQNHFELKNVVRCDSIGERVRPTGIF